MGRVGAAGEPHEISRSLREHETPVSISALSYWQTGENRPERFSSLAAVTTLGTILGQPPQTLTALLGPHRPRERSTNRGGPTLTYEQMWHRPETFARAVAKLGVKPEDLTSPHRLSQHVSYHG